MKRLAHYAKFIAALLTTFAIAAQAPLTDGKITNGEWLAIGISLLGSGAVFGVTNQPAAATEPGKHVRP